MFEVNGNICGIDYGYECVSCMGLFKLFTYEWKYISSVSLDSFLVTLYDGYILDAMISILDDNVSICVTPLDS